MKDLFKEYRTFKTPEDRLLHAVFGDDSKTWLSREKEASEFLSEYIDRHPEELEDAVISLGGLSKWLKTQMDHSRNQFLETAEENFDEEERDEQKFYYAHEVLILSVLRWIVETKENEDSISFIYLCDKGEEAVEHIKSKYAKRKDEKC